MRDISDEEFDRLITQAMDELPHEYIAGLENVAITYEDEPTEEQKLKMKIDHNHLLLGLYEGIPLTQRGNGYSFVLPDKITLFKFPLLTISHSESDFFQHIKRTLWHEMAHYYGLSHAHMDALQNHTT